LGEVLIDITALEVNTMVVERITGDKFIAWEAYREIYPISQQYLEQQEIHTSLRDRYLELRHKLEVEYSLILTDPTSTVYDPSALESATQEQQSLNQATTELDEIRSRLPNPIYPNSSGEILKIQELLHNSRFLRGLRKISELKTALDHRNRALLRTRNEQLGRITPEALQKAVKTDMIYAQTVIQMDGDIINRYSQDIFDHPHREVILQIHQDGVTSGEKQWRGLLEFIIGLVQATLPRSSGKNGFPGGGSK
jgi:hypothetical protein